MTRVQEEEEEVGEEEFTDKSEIERCEKLPEKQARTPPYHNVFTKTRTNTPSLKTLHHAQSMCHAPAHEG